MLKTNPTAPRKTYLPKCFKPLQTFYVVLIVMIALISCTKKEHESNISYNKPNSHIGENRIKFNTIKEFSEILNNIRSVEETFVKQLLIEKGIINSQFKTAYDFNITENKTLTRSVLSSTEKNILVPDPYFASLLNENLEIEVEGNIYKITNYGTFEITKEKFPRINQMIDSLRKNNISLSKHQRKFVFEKNTEINDYYKIEDGVFRFDTYKNLDVDDDENSDIGNSENFIMNNPMNLVVNSITSTGNSFGVPQQNIKTVGYTNDKQFNYFPNRKTRIRANIQDLNWLINKFMHVELMGQVKGWTGGWRGLKNTEELAIELRTLVVKRKMVGGVVDGVFPKNTLVYYPSFKPVIPNQPIPAGVIATLLVDNNNIGTFTMYPQKVHQKNKSSISMGFIPIINKLKAGNVTVEKIDLGCYGKAGGHWIGIEYKK